MERILGLVHAAPDGTLSRASLEVLRVSADVVRASQGALVVGLIGSGATSAASQLAGLGASEVLAVTALDFDAPRFASDAAAAAALARAASASIVLAPATSRMSRALPVAALRLGGRVDTHVTGITPGEHGPLAERWYYRQRMKATFTRETRPWFMTLESGVAAPWSGESGSVAVIEVAVETPEGGWRTRVVGDEAAAAGADTIRPDAPLLFVAGAGWMKKQADGRTHVREAEDLIRNFLETTQASLGSSKSLVDQSAAGTDVITFMTHLNQVGQTGSTPHHRKGIATCCHGEEPHVVGWRFIQERRAVNLDPNCGWARGKADVVYVADAFRVMEKLNELLARR